MSHAPNHFIYKPLKHDKQVIRQNKKLLKLAKKEEEKRNVGIGLSSINDALPRVMSRNLDKYDSIFELK